MKFYYGRELLVLQWIRPKKEMGVHTLDIRTINSFDEGFKVIDVILWTNCSGPSSHNATAGYQEWLNEYRNTFAPKRNSLLQMMFNASTKEF